MKAQLNRMAKMAREHPDVLKDSVRFLRSLSATEWRRLAELSDSDRAAAFELIYRDATSVEVALATVEAS